MAIRKELNLRLPNSPGAFAETAKLLATERVNILAAALEANGQLRLVVDNHVRAGSVLRARHHKVAERDVIVASLPNTCGAFASVLGLVSDAGLNIEYAYAGAGEGAGPAVVVLGIEEGARAAAITGL